MTTVLRSCGTNKYIWNSSLNRFWLFICVYYSSVLILIILKWCFIIMSLKIISNNVSRNVYSSHSTNNVEQPIMNACFLHLIHFHFPTSHHLIFWDLLLSFFTFQHCSNQLCFDQPYSCEPVKCNHVQLDWKSSWSHATVDLYNTYTSLTRYYNRKTYPKI